ncbi:MAG: hypothetical protein IJJ65_05215 [Butyrivibrio sp.]|nr:hypothetical protein [Butyrivibrio sp.]
MKDFKFRILRQYGVLSKWKSGWQKEVNLVSWNGQAPKIDIREWSPDHETMGSGITLSKQEQKKLSVILQYILLNAE